MKILDHGEINLIETWGLDSHIIRAARQSTDGAFRGWGPRRCDHCKGSGQQHHSDFPGHFVAYVDCPKCKGAGEVPGDEKLLRYLYTHNHMTPFEMVGAIFEVKAPIFVFREWHRHRTQSYNEMSARYVEMQEECYLPSIERIMAGAQAKANKQASTEGITKEAAEMIQAEISASNGHSHWSYRILLEHGLSRELARTVLPVSQYSKMWASANLRNWMQFLTLRNSGDAQWEIQQYAKAVQSLLKERFPRTLELFEEGR
jgi:thymidylate synthase (FAD)